MSKEPEDYKGNNIRKRIGLEKGLHHGDSVSYFLTDSGKGYTFNLYDLPITEYRKMLISVLETPLRHMGYNLHKGVMVFSQMFLNLNRSIMLRRSIDKQY